MKLFFMSLGVGVLIPGFLFIALLMVKVLFPGTNTSRVGLWVFTWPIAFIHRFESLSIEAALLLSFGVGTLVDIAAITLVAYVIFNAKLSKRARAGSASPPPPPAFDRSL